MRTFIAIELSPEAKQDIKRIQREFAFTNSMDASYTSQENLHLTLKFLGEIPEEDFESIKKTLKKIKFPEFEVSLGRVGCFSNKILWITLDGEKLIELQKKIDEALKDKFKPEVKFMSHITLARVKEVRDVKRFAIAIKTQRGTSSFKADSFKIKKSTLSPEGAQYEDLVSFSLKK